MLATGATGMIGANLVARLVREGQQVFLFVRPNANLTRLEPCLKQVSLLQGDITDKESVEQAVAQSKPGIVFHLASTAFNPPTTPNETHLQVNTLGTLHLLEALKKESPETKIVFTGSTAAYGSGSGLKEDQPLAPNTMLGASKACASILLQTFAKMHGLNTVELRLFTPYGPWESPRRLIPSLILAALRQQDVPLSLGAQQRDFVYLDDVIDALYQAAVTPVPGGSVFNIGSGVGTTVRAVAELTLRLMGNPVRLKVGELPTRPDEIMEMSADISAARDQLGWQPRTSLKDGLKKTIGWLTENRDLARSLS